MLLFTFAAPAAAQESLPYGFPTPLTTTGNDINLWERTYQFSPTGPIPSIVAKGGVAISSATWILNSIPLTWSDPVVVSESARSAQLTTSSTSVSGWLVSATIDVDYAGRIKIVTTVTRTGGTPAAFSLQYFAQIPAADSGRWLVKHLDYDPATFNVDKDTLLSAHGLYPSEGTSHPFVPTMTVSSYDRGVEFIWETDSHWTPADKTGVTPITTTDLGANRLLVVTPVPVSSTITLDTDETWTDKILLFGLPMRPPTTNSFAYHAGSHTAKNNNWIAGTGKRYLDVLFTAGSGLISDRHVPQFFGIPSPRLHQPWRDLQTTNNAASPVYRLLPYGALQLAPAIHPLIYTREKDWAANDSRFTAWANTLMPSVMAWANYTHMDREGNPYSCPGDGSAPCQNAHDTWFGYQAGCSEDFWTWRRSQDIRALGDKRIGMGGLYYDFGSLSRACEWGTPEHPIEVVESGTATGGSAQQMEDSGAAWDIDEFDNHYMILRRGEPNEERRQITSNTETTLDIQSATRAWYDPPANGDTYEILRAGTQVWPYEWMYDYYKTLWEQAKSLDPDHVIVAHVNGGPRALGAFTSIQAIGEGLNVPFGTRTAANISGCEGGCTDGTQVCTPFDAVTATDGGYCPDYFDIGTEWLDSVMWPRVGGTAMLLPQVSSAVNSEERIWQNNIYAASWAAGMPVWFGNFGAYFGDYRALENAFEQFGSRLDTDLIVTPDANRGDTTTITHGLRATVWGRPTDAPCDVGTCTYPAMLVLVNPTNADITDGTVQINDRAALGIPDSVDEWERWDPTTMPARPGGTGNISVQDGLDMWSAAEGFCEAGPEIQGITVPAKSFVLYVLGDGGAAESASCATGGDTLLSEDFEALSAGTEITDWLETGVNNALTENDALFGVVDESGNNVVQTTAFPGNNAHVHYQGAGADLWANYELTGTMRTSETSGNTGIGVTWYSDYPDSDTYYRLRTFAGGAFVLSSHPETSLFDCDSANTGVTPVAGTTYDFRVRTENYPTENVIFLKIWDAAGSEPSEWQMTCTDPRESRPTEGTVGMWSYAIASPGTVNTWDDFEATSIVSSFVPECSDGLDNDSDGFIDHPADADCESTADNSEATITLTPTLVVTPDTLSVEAAAGGADFTSQQLALTNPGDEFSECEYACSLQASDDMGGTVGTDWIQVSGSGTLPFTDPSGPGAEEFCTIDGAGSGECSEGTYDATVRVACTGASNTPQDIPVTLDCVGAIPPTVEAGPNQSVPGGGTIQLDGSITNPADGPLWTFTAGTCSGFSPSNAVLNPTFLMTDDPHSCTAQLCDGAICDSVTVTVPEPAGSGSSISAAGITFEFDEEYTTGFYLDGMPWVVENEEDAGVVITAMTPNFAGDRNGWAENPISQENIPPGTQGCAKTKACKLLTYDSRPSLSQARHLYKSPVTEYGPLPRTITAGTSVIKTKSDAAGPCPGGGSTSRCIETAAVLTVLASPPPPNALRPPYPNALKPHFVMTGFDIDDLIDLPALPSDQVTWSTIYSRFGDFPAHSGTDFPGEFRGRYTPGSIGMVLSGNPAVYGCDYSNTLFTGVLAISQRTALGADPVEVERLLYHLLNVAIDQYYAISPTLNYNSRGCIVIARKAFMMWAGKILNSLDQGSLQSVAADMESFTARTEIHGSGVSTRESVDEYTRASAVPGISIWGDTTADCSNGPFADKGTLQNCNNVSDGGCKAAGTDGDTCPGAGQRPVEDLIDDGLWSMGPYQNASSPYFGAAAIARIYDLEAEWDHVPFWEYIDRINGPPWNRPSGSNGNLPYLREMFGEFGCDSPECEDARTPD